MTGINRNKNRYSNLRKMMQALLAALLVAPLAMAQGGGKAPVASSIYNPFVMTMIIVMLILLLAIILLANVVTGAAGYYYEKEKEREQKRSGNPTATALSIIGLLLFTTSAFAQDADITEPVVQTANSFGGLSPTAYYFITGVIGVELLVIFVLLYMLRVFLQKEKSQQALAVATHVKPRISLWDKLNKFRPVEQEAEIDLQHENDGIRELDNRLPPWWLYSFYVSIIFAGIYLWKYHVSHTAPLSGEEYTIAMQQAEVLKAQYLKKAANNVDENTVTLLTGAADIANGQKVFTQNCAACHGRAGEGTVGPNLTDDYWLHGGSVKDIFKTVKYGWPEKGMRSWKEDLSPVQIAQVTSYIRSLHGSNPSNAKEKQGELYNEEISSGVDSNAVKMAVVTEK
ncbi:MAG TPA: cbb3-type cytochrome c oxidase N-terminal domain-containing protein [Niastella sp.]